ncbi:MULTISPECIES: MoaD/ThiS family protein [unclassified Campylobacter]|uniref:MoaD/ThiS family protein n=1 Tax=unclassified Campylobacter TaxID=2593542 RepID=UPI00123816DD|nr:MULTISPECIES: MoaD/ThiS family protein [unclassified Campylobacter]KAA6226464.1 MoaD/ThiS family protein [Campylobacter sp. LR185c]KAA6228600.1 MoaD/ThiS family protein [Campylobacter sp. LR196d]KAA6229153.1 MoaD/ThiS family protein [Campylobacter sp. LR286c]KAA6233944.1 MoaD/ThiS family protein [Campylobacter sp. LR291e]KAA6234182.1 MoaD/ThiS family protein [Campylobacter sp. LR264d]
MIEIEFLGPIKKDKIKIKASSLKEVKEILKQDESLKEWLSLCAVSLNDELIFDENQSLKPGDRLALLPPVCGG